MDEPLVPPGSLSWSLATNPAAAEGEDRNLTGAVGRALPWSADLERAIRVAAVRKAAVTG